MTLEVVVVALVRLLGSATVLRWSLAGAAVAIALDLSDLALFHVLHLGGVPDYQAFDKAVDTAVLLMFVAVALRWGDPFRWVAVALFAVRMVGVVLFELSGWRPALVVFPNVLELWFLLAAVLMHHAPDRVWTARRALGVVALLTLLKLPQELFLHVDRRLDEVPFSALTEWLG